MLFMCFIVCLIISDIPVGMQAIQRELKERLCDDDGMIYSYPFKVLDMEKGDVDPEEDEEVSIDR